MTHGFVSCKKREQLHELNTSGACHTSKRDIQSTMIPFPLSLMTNFGHTVADLPALLGRSESVYKRQVQYVHAQQP